MFATMLVVSEIFHSQIGFLCRWNRDETGSIVEWGHSILQQSDDKLGLVEKLTQRIA